MPDLPLHRTVRTLESYIAYSPPTSETIVDAEVGLAVPYEARWAKEIFTWLSSGRSLVSYCQQPNKPARSLVVTWLNDVDGQYDELRDRFEKGMLNRALCMVDEAGEVIDEDLLQGPKGFLDPVSMADKKQRVEGKLKLAALLDPSKFAPLSKTAQQIALTQVNVTKNNVVELTDEQLQRVLADFERKKHEHIVADVVTGPTSGDSGAGAVDSSQCPQLPG